MLTARNSDFLSTAFEAPLPDQADPKSWLAAIVHSSDDAIISKDLNGHIMSWNEAAEQLFGYSLVEALGKSITLIIPSDRLDEEDQILSRIRTGQRLQHFETVRRRKDGSLIDVSLTVSPIRNPSGRIIGASKIARDISLQKQLERDQAESERQKNEFLGILAHELRNPLAPIRTSLEVIRVMEEDPATVRRVRVMMERQVDQLVRLINDIGDVARVSNGALDLKLELVNIHDVLHGAIDASKPRIEEARHRLTLDVPAEPLLVVGDRLRLVQVMTNLLNNAARYTDAGGRISLSAVNDEERVRITVRDNGIGISSAELPRIVQMFVRSDAARTRTREGLGVGLPLAKRLVELHDGTLNVESDGPGKGSTFTVWLPRVDDDGGLS